MLRYVMNVPVKIKNYNIYILTYYGGFRKYKYNFNRSDYKKINSLEYTECLLSCIINNKGKVDNVFKSTNELMDEIKNVEYNYAEYESIGLMNLDIIVGRLKGDPRKLSFAFGSGQLRVDFATTSA